MTRWAKQVGGLALLALSACATPQPPKPASLAPGRQVLVTFPDERINQTPIADPANPYRRRDDYANSTWSRRVAGQFAEDYGLRPLVQWPINSLGLHCVVYEIPAEASAEDVLRRLGQDSRVETAQTLHRFHTLAETYNDPYFKLQTDLQAMHIEPAHRLATGRGVSVAVIDTGVDSRHPDLAGNIGWTQDFATATPDDGAEVHGTAVAGVIAAEANNRQGIVGTAPNAQILALRACWPTTPLKPEAACDSLTLALAVDAAIKLKPGLINLSLAGPHDRLVERLVSKALEAGIIVVAAAPSAEAQENFPASVPGVIAVRTAPGGGGALAAPGQEILTTLPNGGYAFLSGSSFAAAHVSGLAALLLELKPGLSGGQIRSLLQTSPTLDARAAVDRLIAAPLAGR